MAEAPPPEQRRGQPLHRRPACRIAVEEEDQLPCLGPLQGHQVARGEGGGAERHRVPDPCLVQPDDVEVALHQHAALAPANLVARPVQRVQGLALGVEPRLARVEVLRSLVALDQPTPEGHRPPVGGADGDHQPAAEDVVHPLGLGAALHQPGGDAELEEPPGQERIRQPGPRLGRPTQARRPGPSPRSRPAGPAPRGPPGRRWDARAAPGSAPGPRRSPRGGAPAPWRPDPRRPRGPPPPRAPGRAPRRRRSCPGSAARRRWRRRLPGSRST